MKTKEENPDEITDPGPQLGFGPLNITQPGFSHTDSSGRARMVDVGSKADQLRVAVATGFIRLQAETISLIMENLIKKGDVLTVAEIAGVQAAKQTAALIPLCHNINLTSVRVTAELEVHGAVITAEVRSTGPTGVEMEALTGVAVALLTIYDMCKAVDKSMVIEAVRLIEKTKGEPLMS